MVPDVLLGIGTARRSKNKNVAHVSKVFYIIHLSSIAFTCLPQDLRKAKEIGQKPIKRKHGHQEQYGEGGESEELSEDENEKLSDCQG